jgi:integrase
MLNSAKHRSLRDHAFLRLLRDGLRVGEIVGCHDRTVYTRWKDSDHKELGRENCESVVDLPGLYYQDIRRDARAVWVKGKGSKVELYPLTDPTMDSLVAYVHQAALGPGSKLFEVSESKAEDLFRFYAREAGIEDWNRPGFGPHRFRAFTATDMADKGFNHFQIRDRMRHSRIQTTEQYVGRSTSKQLRSIVDKLSELDQAQPT